MLPLAAAVAATTGSTNIARFNCHRSFILSVYCDKMSDAPSEPRDLEITKYDKSSVTLKWKQPTDDGGNPIQGQSPLAVFHLRYFLYCSHINEKECRRLVPT